MSLNGMCIQREIQNDHKNTEKNQYSIKKHTAVAPSGKGLSRYKRKAFIRESLMAQQAIFEGLV